MTEYNVAVVGATGVVGKEIIKVLQERKFKVKKISLLASQRSSGMTIMFNRQDIQIEVLDKNSFKGIDIALFSAGGSISKDFVPIAVESGAVAIDNTSYFRMHPEVPLVVPEINPQDLKKHKGIIANPNCSTAQMVMALKPIHDYAVIKRVVVATYQSVSGTGKDALEELEGQSRKNLAGQEYPAKVYPHPIAFNVLPHIDVFTENGYTKEEMKMINETQKIMDPNIAVTATTVRVPVFIGHSESVNIQTEKKISAEKARELLSQMPGVEVMDDPENNIYPTPRETVGRNEVFVGRIREDISIPNGLELWCVADNLRKGAALNAVQIAEKLIEMGLK
ncbi:aspartate-semialdehyde dehydrogenase [Candidatus Margulisiibacteriota bacterium]